ncbi:MAG: TIGR04083 family peptide-modifying radical SAM enzyme, partial [Methanomicrobiales archaeon]|nr:TIGR04083 family peptide-modifying radical SAM enzyme [Methanomicrobiales archaeon]
FHVMLIPTLGCPSNCHYCWSSDEDSPMMSMETIREVAAWLKDFDERQVTITFHGGEPLLAGPKFYREALHLLSDELSHLKPTFAIQTNLWLMTPELAQIFAAYQVPIGSSIDGPKEINDIQRGTGYFDKTMHGYRIARENGLFVRFICTFTRQSVDHREEIFHFFMENGFALKLHPALPSLKGDNPEKWALAPEKYGDLLIYLLDKYLENLDTAEIMNINDLLKSVFTRTGNVCTFNDCMGNTFAIGPDGSIYPCYRFVGMPEWVMGKVYERPTKADLAESRAWKLMHAFKDFVDEHCKECPHIRYCRGGCPYNAIAPTGGRVEAEDPHCPAYKQIFDEFNDRLNKELYGSAPTDMGMGGPRRKKRKGKAGIMDLMQKMVSE